VRNRIETLSLSILSENVIGFRLGDFKSGSNQVVEPYCCQHISKEMKDFIKVFFISLLLSL